MTIEFRDPPVQVKSPGGPSRYRSVLAELAEHPKRWAVMGEKDNANRASALRTYLKRIAGPDYEFAARKGEVFGRYIGPE